MATYYLSHAGIKGMKWGVRRYQNLDGTLTDAGKKRYNRDIRELSDDKKKTYEASPDKWVRDDLESGRSIANEGANIAGKLKKINDRAPKKAQPRLNLDSMTDQEMRAKINRELVERQYNDLFNPQNVSKGRAAVSKTLEVAGDVLGVTASALFIAVQIRKLKNGE